LLDEYAEHGTAQFAMRDVSEVQPISQHGNVKEIAAKFDGTDKLMEAVSQL
jgi:type I restriction enzyme R subunit